MAVIDYGRDCNPNTATFLGWQPAVTAHDYFNLDWIKYRLKQLLFYYHGQITDETSVLGR
jgi:hypothetical protein